MPAFPRRVTIHDISESGCKRELRGAPLELGGTALLEVPGVPKIAGHIVWCRGSMAGVQFERPLTRHAAWALGMDAPDPEPVVEEVAEPEKTGGLLRHWFRRLTRRFA
jgi:hypothetical protein